MAKTYNKLNIEINQKVTDIITAVQDDTNSRYLDVQLFDNGTPINLTGQEVRIFLKKPDGTNIWNNGEVTNATEGRCQFLLTTQTLAVCGVLETQISIWQNNEEILSTEIFKIFVTKSLRSSGSIESSNEYGSLVILFQNIYEALDLMTEMVQSFGTAGAVAQGIPVTTFWQMLEAVYTVNAEALANASVSEVLNRMGLTNDSGATATTGTLMAKMNNLIISNAENVPYMALGLAEYKSYYIQSSIPTQSPWETAVEVLGEGYFSGAAITTSGTSIATSGVRITIDGNIIFSGLSNNDQSFAGLVNTNYIFYYGSKTESYFGKTKLEQVFNFIPYYQSTYESPNAGAIVGTEIPFTQSLKIETINNDTVTAKTFSCLYHIKNN